MEKQPILSICIPTFKREYIIDKLIEGILVQNCDESLYEICITDNSETDETKELIERKYASIRNLHYKKVKVKGFLNSIEALKFGQGKLLKLHNDYSMFLPGSLQKLIDQAVANDEEEPLIFYTLRGKKSVERFDNFDAFIKCINYLSTWSTSFAIWKTDLDRLLEQRIECNYMYPHTTLLFKENNKTGYLVDDTVYFESIIPKKKGGYNLIDNFVRIYLTMVNEDLLKPKIISASTYRRIEFHILRFCAANYVNTKTINGYSFTFDDSKGLITNQCGWKGYLVYRLFIPIYILRHYISRKK